MMRAVRNPSAGQSKRWCFTVNNPTQLDEVCLTTLGPRVHYLVYGREIAPTTLTPHLQGFVIFHGNKRFAAAQRELPPGCHLEQSSGTSAQASEYCKKENDFVEFGSVPVPGKTNRYDDFREWIIFFGSRPTLMDVAREFPSIYLTCNNIESFIDSFHPRGIATDPGVPRDYQRVLEAQLAVEADPRKIVFVVDPVGNSGKTWFTDYMSFHRPADTQVLSVGRREDLSYAIDELRSIFLFDLPRSSGEFLQYTVLEQLKNRRVFSSKYQSRVKFLNEVPHVVVFMNEYPDMTKLSGDRYVIIVWNYEV